MSCCCNSSPCVCVPQCPESCPEVIEKSVANINLVGAGLYSGEVNDQFQFRGIVSPNSTILVATNNTTHTVELSVDPLNFKTTTTFANAATRANTIPAFIGQIGYQIDTGRYYEGWSVFAGDWRRPLMALDTINTTDTSGFTSIDVGGTAELRFNILGTGDMKITTPLAPGAGVVDITARFEFQSNSIVNFNDTSEVNFNSSIPAEVYGPFHIESTGTLNLITGSTFQVNSVTVPASSVIVTSGSAGQISSRLLNTFLSSANTQTGWGTPTGTLSRLTFDEATVTLPQLAQRVAALITDLKLIRLPAT